MVEIPLGVSFYMGNTRMDFTRHTSVLSTNNFFPSIKKGFIELEIKGTP